MMETTITLPFVYDFTRALDRLSNEAMNSVDLSTSSIRFPMEEGNLVKLQATGTTERPSFLLKGTLNDAQVEEVKSIFHFDRSLVDIQAHFMDTDLAPIFSEHVGTPIVRSFSLYSNLMRSIIHQQLNMSFAHTLTMRFVETFGSEMDGVWRFPSPEKIALLAIDELREMQFSARKAEYMIGLSQAIAEGSLDLEKYKYMEDAEVTADLITYRGVGPWTAQSFLMSGLGRPNVFPIADIGLQNALRRLWKMDKKPSKDEIAIRFPDWSPYLSYAALYLWRSIE
ncbi:DNA-3-methyladenine glycosylase family protein [Sporosarcina sp. FA9]|uniref:DNA-3-methyladenine glycosylase family protein n=1 Tax=Sporosarcina sp. FA9 TaxID=3413030 RepID=UPI003F65C97D